MTIVSQSRMRQSQRYKKSLKAIVLSFISVTCVAQNLNVFNTLDIIQNDTKYPMGCETEKLREST